jgi:hypothetical protein
MVIEGSRRLGSGACDSLFGQTPLLLTESMRISGRGPKRRADAHRRAGAYKASRVGNGQAPKQNANF